MTKERAIIMSAPMVRPTLADRKTQTRRIVNQLFGFGRITEFGVSDTPGYDFHFRDRRLLWHDVSRQRVLDACPYGKPGERLWVRETCRADELESDDPLVLAEDEPAGIDGVRFQADNAFVPIEPTRAAAEDWIDLYAYRGGNGRTVPPIHMPRWASRITLELTDVRVERLRQISEEDAKAEAAEPHGNQATKYGLLDAHGLHWKGCMYRRGFAVLWDSLNAKRAPWASNPWVWVLGFRSVTDG